MGGNAVGVISMGMALVQQAFGMGQQVAAMRQQQQMMRQQMVQTQGNAPQCPQLNETPTLLSDGKGGQVWVCVENK